MIFRCLTPITLGVIVLFPSLTLSQKFDAPITKQPDEKGAAAHSTPNDKAQRCYQGTSRKDAEPRSRRCRDLSQSWPSGSFGTANGIMPTMRKGRSASSIKDFRRNRGSGGEPVVVGAEGKSVARAYRSNIDGSVQPYGVTFPPSYGKDPAKKWRLDIVLHGRDSTLTEVKFLYQHNVKEAPKDQEFVQIDIYGRGNNAYRWAGESGRL